MDDENTGGCLLICLGGLLILSIIIALLCGIGGWGPTNIITATVITKHVDSGNSSAYMVTTNKGTFEVNNGILIWTWNSDEIYGQIEQGKTYEFTTKGNKVIFLWFMQHYPYITNAKLVK